MLHFLSLAYEAIAGSWLDMVEAGTLKADTGLKLYEDLIAIFLQVSSPFAPYQERLAQLEAKYSGAATKLLANDIRNAVTGVGSDLESLQVATDKLRMMSSSVFPMAEGAVARFELLSGGYGAASALATIDKILEDHAGELALAVNALLNGMTSDDKHLADNFDDSHVLCALEVLKIAGSFRRELRALEDKTRDRMQVLSERMTANTSREREAQDFELLDHSSSVSGSRFDLPYSMSAVDIDSIITKEICMQVTGDDANTSLSILQHLWSDDRTFNTIFPAVEEAQQRLAHSCQTFVFDVCSSVPRRHLNAMSSMPSWKEESGADNIASYGTLPQQYITLIGEHMLALVQALEPFSSDPEALSLANEAMGGVRDVALPAWRELMKAAGSLNTEVARTLMDGKDIRGRVLGGVAVEEEEDIEGEDSAAKASTEFCNAWLDVVGLAVTGRLLERIMRIPSLTLKGCEHLNADLNYLVNVFSALGVADHPHPLVSHLAELAILDGDMLAQRISGLDRSDRVDDSLAAVEERLAAIRNVGRY
jgi:hypothetical protein